MPTVVYLDQNKWIRLLQQREGTDTDPEIERVLDRLTAAVEDGEAIVPVSQYHMVETATSHNRRDRRDHLFELMMELSEYWTIAIANIVMRQEVPAYFRKMQGEKVDFRTLAIGKGLPFMLGGDNWAFVYTGDEHPEDVQLPPEKKARMLDAFQGREAFEISWEEGLEIFQRRDHEADIVDKLEKNRKLHEEKFSSNARRRRVAMARHYTNEVIEELGKLCLQHDLPLNTWAVDLDAYIRQGEEAEEATQFLRSFPSNYTYSTLTVTRDLQKQRPIDKNDLNDIMALSVAIPYCDIVVTEKFWAHEAKSNCLDKIYETHITRNLSEIDPLLNN